MFYVKFLDDNAFTLVQISCVCFSHLKEETTHCGKEINGSGAEQSWALSEFSSRTASCSKLDYLQMLPQSYPN